MTNYKEFDFLGVYLAPFAPRLVVAILLFFALRAWLDRREVGRWVWNRPVFDTAVFACVLALVVLF